MGGIFLNDHDQLKQGAIIKVNFDPTKGREQRGWRPAMVVSNESFVRYTGLYKVVPISSKYKTFPLHVDLPKELKVHGQVLTQHERTLDLSWRNFEYVEDAPYGTVQKVLELIKMTY